MNRLVFLISMFILSSSYGCSFIKEHFAKKQSSPPVQEGQEQNQENQEKKSEPIPVNPQHS